jgi:hypothetical protein
MPIEALLLGLSTGTYCVMSCAPYALPLLVAEGSGLRRNAVLVGVFLTGRLVGYLAVGAVLGAVGAYALRYVPPRAEIALAAIGYMVAGAFLILQGISYTGRAHRLCAAVKAGAAGRNAGVLGLASGFSLCPPFVAAAGRVFALSSGSTAGTVGGGLLGLLYFACFFVGTSVFFLPLFGLPFAKRGVEGLRRVARVTMIMLGLYFFFALGIFRLVA